MAFIFPQNIPCSLLLSVLPLLRAPSSKPPNPLLASSPCNHRRSTSTPATKTKLCGWGVEDAESINKGEFIIKYVTEVLDNLVCTQRLWDMKNKEVKIFYMPEIRKDFTIDATFKVNSFRFLNHSCDPNCKLEKWQVEAEIHVGVFAARPIKAGEQLTYDYREVMTLDGAQSQGSLLTIACVPRLKELNRKRVHVQWEWGPLDFD